MASSTDAFFEQQVAEVRQRRRDSRAALRSAAAKSACARSRRSRPMRATPRLFSKNARSGAVLEASSNAENAASAAEKSRRWSAASAQANRPSSRNTFRPMFKIDVVTLFPELFAPFVGALDRRPRGRERHDERALPPSARRALPTASAPTTRRSAAVRVWYCGSSPSRELSTVSPRRLQDERRAIVVPSPSGAPFTHRDARALGVARPLRDRLRALRGNRRPLGSPLSARRTFPRRLRAHRGRDSGARLHGCDGPAASGSAAPRIARRASRFPPGCSTIRASPVRRPFAASTSRPFCSRAITRKSRSGDESSRGSGPRPAGGTSSTIPPCRARKARDRIRWFCRAPCPAIRCAHPLR